VVQLQGYLTIQENNKILQITIEDNGKGFDTSTFYILEGLELTIKARIKALKELLKLIKSI
jgi:signal transduction histidine kinase